jgi:glyoxylase-like metal-dependent hydrolase (beta-lactamase superfamily II)
MKVTVQEFFDKSTWTLTYVAYDASSKDGVIIDPVWDYDPATSKLSTASVEQVLKFVETENLKIHFLLETHAHADHVSGSQILRKNLPGARVAIGSRITEVQKVFKNIFNLHPDFPTDGSQFDILLNDGAIIEAGTLRIKTLHTPGHTPACSTYVIDDAVFTGDALFMPDYGTGRCDFPSGSADDLYQSVHEVIYKLPDHYRVFVGHDYLPNDRGLKFQSTIGEERTKNIQLRDETPRDEFIHFRRGRDSGLTAPRLLLPSIQINIDAGHPPKPEDNGISYLRIPLKTV